MEHSRSSLNNVPPINSGLHHYTNGDQAKELVSLSKILKEALAKTHSTIDTHRIILRCDELPSIEGDKALLEKLFVTIINFIVSHPPAGIKQFLYVQCKEELLGSDTISSVAGAKFYTIQFHTNIALADYWQIVHQSELTACELIAEKHGGRFIINNMESGCLFTLHLSGKPI